MWACSYDTGKECDEKMKALLFLIESMLEDVPSTITDDTEQNGGTTAVLQLSPLLCRSHRMPLHLLLALCLTRSHSVSR